MDWQTGAALGVVAVTAAIFVLRFIKKRRPAAQIKKKGCGSGCACPATLKSRGK